MRKIITTLILFLTTHCAIAETEKCIGIKPDKKRLDCFDIAAKLDDTGRRSQAVATLEARKDGANLMLKALRKLAGATEIGISMRDYGQLVLEQSYIIDEAMRGAPSNEFKSSITKSRQAFVDARTIWGSMFESQYVSIFLGLNKSILSQYPIDEGYMKTLSTVSTYAKTEDMNKSIILSPIWATAKEALSKAENMAKQQ